MTNAMLTFGEAMDHWAAITPTETVLACALETGEIDELNREQLRAWSNRLAHKLIQSGIGMGDLVPIILPTSVDFLAAATAIYKAGGSPMPVSHKLPKPELESLLELATPKCLIANDSTHPKGINPAEYREGADPGAPERRISNPVKALASGGSTGRSKLIITEGEFLYPEGGHPTGAALRLNRGELKYSPGPLYHNGPFFFSLIALFQGGSVLLNQRFNAERALRLIAQYRPSTLNLVPTMMQRMLQSPEWQGADLNSVKTVWHLAAPCPHWAKEAFIERLGGDVVLELWAATENTGLTIIDGHEWLAHRGSVGKPVGTEIVILNEDRNPVATGEVGEIFTRFAGAPANYRYLGSKSLETWGDGFASVGDLGWLDADGYLYLADRRTDLIISGGANIFPAEIESVISQHPGVQDVAVVGLSDSDLGRRTHAIVEPNPNGPSATADELLALCQEQLAHYKVPRSIEFVDQLPRNEAGKIRRLALREARELSA